jgi:transcriptional regulator GlxA family with amidase domain
MSALQNKRFLSRRASELLLTRFDERWSVGGLARALGLSSRTLHRVTRREFGVSPMALLRQSRLARARAVLRAHPGVTVTRVALDCGFAHLGRFAQEYARHFGECPSETLRRARLERAAATAGIPEKAPTAA